MDRTKLVEQNLDAFETVTTKLLPLALALALGYVFQPVKFQELLFGVPLTYASAAVLIVAATLTSIRVRTIVALTAIADDETAVAAMRCYSTLSNPFYETGSNRYFNLFDLHGVALTTFMSVIFLAVALELFYTTGFPALLNDSATVPERLASMVSTIAIAADGLLLGILRRDTLELLNRVASSTRILERKMTALSIIGLLVLVVAASRYSWLFWNLSSSLMFEHLKTLWNIF
jgi:hypothetical protein